MNRLILTPIVVLWVALTAQAQFYNNGLLTNTNTTITDAQLTQWINAANGVYNGSGALSVFEHRGASAQTFTNLGTYSATAGHTDRFTGPGGSAGAQEIAGNRQPLFYNLDLNNGSGRVINITNTAGVLVSNRVAFANGITTTGRSNPTAGALRLAAGATYTGGTTDAQHVDGYVSKTGNTAFTFPVGSGTDIRTLAMSAPTAATNQYSVAWIVGNPDTTPDPSDAQPLHPRNSRDETMVNEISPVGQWDWIATSGTGAGLTISVSIPDMTAFDNAESLRLVGWNGTRWINLSTGVKPYLSGNSYATGNTANSTLEGTMVAGISAIGIGGIGLPVRGTVFYDGNGLTDRLVARYGNGPDPLNGTDCDPLTAGAQALYATLVTSNGTPVMTMPVTAAGTFSFSNVTTGFTYSVVLSTNPAGSTVSVLPANFVSTGEKVNNEIDPTPDGIATGIQIVRDLPEFGRGGAIVDFAINRRPVAKSTQVPPQPTPGPGVQVPVPATAFGGVDLEDAPRVGPGINTYSYDLRGRPVTLQPATGGTLYYLGNPVSASLVIPVFDPDQVTISVANARTTLVSFPYSIRDEAGLTSALSSITLPFIVPVLSISGQVFNDGNGLTDNLVNQIGNGPNPLNGTDFDLITAGSQSLFATLVGSTGNALGTVPLTTTGTYSFTGVSPGTYSVVLGTNAAGGTTPSLLNTWVNTGEQLGTGPGSDEAPDGILTGIVVSTSVINGANFGINKRPEGATAFVPAQPNPGGNTQVPIPATAFRGTDLEDGTYANNLTGREVTLLPASGGTLYYAGNPVSTTTTIASFDPSRVTVDPTATQATTVQFTYLIKDNAGTSSNPATTVSFISVSFTGDPIAISGTVFDDANGQTDNTVNGPPINGTAVPPLAGAPVPLYVTLALEATQIATVPVSAAGTYSFSDVIGNRAYNLVLTTNPAGDIISSTLPAGWVNTGAFVGTGPGNTGTFPGVQGVSVGTNSVSNANFGIDRRPEGAAVTLSPQANPDGNAQVPISATAFTGTDLEDGPYPNNLTGRAVTLSAAGGGTLYYNSVPLSTSTVIASFDPTKVTLDPTAPASTTVTFTYQIRDNAGASSQPVTITLPFTGPAATLSGTVFDDGNGLTDNLVNGTGVNGLALPLYASLVSNQVVATVPVTGAGAYSFTGVGSGTYSVVLTTNSGGSTTASLPANWVSTGEQLGTGPGSDGTPNGILTGISVGTANVGAANLGIDQKPVVANGAMPPLSNPGGTAQSPVFASVFAGSDPEDGPYANNLSGREVTLTAATGGTLYYNGSPVSGASVITNFDPAQVKLDPTAQKETVVTFAVAVKDNAGVLSDPKTIVVPFSDDQNDEEDDNDDPDEDDGNEDPDDDDDGDNDNDGKRDNRVRVPTTTFSPIIPTIRLPFPIGVPPILIGILIPTFPINAIFVIINGTVYTKDTFPPEGVIVRTNEDGELEDDLVIEPEDPTKPVPIPFVGVSPTGTPVTTPGNTNVQPTTLINNGPLSCTNTAVTLTAGGTGTYRFSNGATQVAGGNTATVTGAGTYYVIVTGPNGYRARAATVVTADQSVPAATLSSSGLLSCSTTSVTLTAGGVGTYAFSAGATQIGTGPTATVTQAGIYEVTVTAANGCRATASIRVVADQSVPAATLVNNGPLSCTNTTVTLTASGVGTYRFSAGATQVAGGNTATVTEAGVYSVTVTAANGCSATAQTTVNSASDTPLRIINQPVSSSTVTVGATVTASVSVTGPGPVYQWYKDNGTPVVGQTSAVLNLSNVQRSDAGRYVVVVSGPCNTGVASLTSSAFTLTVNPNSLILNVSATPDTLLTTETTRLTATALGGTPPYSYTFSGPGQITVTGNTATVASLTAGVQTFTVVASDATTPASQTISATVSVTVSAPAPVNTAPEATTNASQTATVGVAFSYTVNAFTDAETPNSLTYAASINPANGLSFDPVTRVISGVPSTTGVSSVTITATDPGSLSASTSFAITVRPIPAPAMATLSGTTTICVGSSAALRVILTSGTAPYTVVYSDGLRSTTVSGYTSGSGIGVSPVQSTTYVLVSVADSIGTLVQGLSGTAIVTVSPVPVARISGALTVCQGQSATLTASDTVGSPGIMYRWNTGETTATISATTGTYSVTITTLSGCTATASATVSPSSIDFGPLVELYNRTGGANWLRKDNWLTGCTPCNWYGVSCDGNGRVTALSLLDNNLTGSLPASLSGLTSLTLLELGNNALLSGGIPGSLSALTGLRTLNLSRTQLGGTIPDGFGTLVNLENLFLNESGLTGAIPASLGGLTKLQDLQLYANQLTGCFPNSLSALCGNRVINFTNNPGLPGGGDFGAFCASGAGSCTPVNTAPVATTNASQTAIIGQPFAYTVNAFTDAQTPDSLTYAASIDPGNGLSFDPVTRVISGVPGTTGVSIVTITATDPGSLSVGTSFTITVSPAPVVGPPLAVTLTASPAMLLTTGTTTLSATVSGGISPYTYSFNGLGIITEKPGSNTARVSGLAAGVQMLNVTVTDASLPTSQRITAFVSVTVSAPAPINAPPVAATNASQTATVGTAFSYTVNAFTDAETPNSLTYAASINPTNGLSFDPAMRVISGVPSTTGVSSVTITATDPGSLSASTGFTITVLPAPIVVPPLALTLTANPTTVLTTGATTLSATVTGGTEPYSYNFSGLGIINGSPRSNTATVSGLTAGVQTLNVLVTDATLPTSQRISATVSVTVAEANTAPTVANPIPAQVATVGQAFSYVIPASTFTDGQTPNALVLTVSGLPAGLSFTTPATISGTPSVSGVSSVTVTVTDPAELSASTTFTLTVSPAGTTPSPTGPFAITSVTTISCTPVGNQISLSFTPQYGGVSGQPISFRVVNELAATTNAGPYTLSLYVDNPVISLRAVQSGTAGEATFSYNWLAACNGTPPTNTAPTVANAIPAQVTTVGQAFSYMIPASTFTDAETPNALALTVSGLPAGLNFTAPATISGIPSVTGTSTVTVRATDPGSLSASTTFTLTVSPAGTTPSPTGTFAITGVTTISCTMLSAGERSLIFNPQYSGVTGQPITFRVLNELAPTTNGGPYTLRLYTDNPVISLRAVQSGTAGEATFSYNWLAACGTGARIGAEPVASLQVRVLGNPVGKVVEAEVTGAEGRSLNLTLTDAQGQTLNQHRVEQAATVETIRFNVSSRSTGILLLQATTPTQSKTVRMLKAE